MSIQTMKKEILGLKRAAAIEYKQSEDYRIQNMTDEELREAIIRDLREMGFQSEEELHEAARKYFAENGLRTTFHNSFDFQDYVFEHLYDIVKSRGANL